jgi:pimeloyl-ACP methyl ester carboxylesterase
VVLRNRIVDVAGRNTPGEGKAFQDRHAATFPNHEGIVVPKGYHFPMTVDPDLYAETIRDWWHRRVAKQAI